MIAAGGESMGRPEYDYCLLRTALERHGKPLTRLEEAERRAAEAVAERAFRLERKILDSREAAGVVIRDEAVERAFAEVGGRYPDPAALAADLAAHGLDEAGLRRALRWHLRVEAVLEKVAAAAGEVSEVEAELYYHLHPDRFLRPERRTVRQILITVNDDLAENRRPEAQRRIEALAAELAGHPERFGALAQRHSECPSAFHQGLIGTVPAGTLYPELDAVLFALPAGAVSAVVESPLGFHLLRCEAIQPAGPIPFAEVSGKIRERLGERQRQRAQREWLGRL